MNIILIGFMGSGKSAVGRQLAHARQVAYFDTDDLVEAAAGQKITEIFAAKGEAYFRELEAEVLQKFFFPKDFVLATGGGIVLRPANVERLKQLGSVVLLWAEVETIYQRIKEEKQRPLLNVPDPQAELRRILEVRRPLYWQAADLVVETTGKEIPQIVQEILAALPTIKG